MANWQNLKSAITDVIKTNENQEITGALLQNTFISTINSLGENATFAGIAIPSTNPGIPDGPVFYLAIEPGQYVNFAGIEVGRGELAIFHQEDESWVATVLQPAVLKTSSGSIYTADADNSVAESAQFATVLGASNYVEGNHAFATGFGTQAIGENSHAEGTSTVASGTESHAEGDQCQASGNSSHAEGDETIASGNQAHAEGHLTQAIGSSSHAEGKETKTTGAHSHAEGFSTVAEGEDSHAEGRNAKTTGVASHAEGLFTEANGAGAHAEGEWSIANGDAAHAEGVGCNAEGEGAHAEGINTSANNPGEHACGKYNVSSQGDNAADRTVFSVGIGNGNARKNGFEVRENGDAYFWRGDSYVRMQDEVQKMNFVELSNNSNVDLEAKDNEYYNFRYAVSELNIHLPDTLSEVNGEMFFIRAYLNTNPTVRFIPGGGYGGNVYAVDGITIQPNKKHEFCVRRVSNYDWIASATIINSNIIDTITPSGNPQAISLDEDILNTTE